jgi:hypothetical protein
MAELKRQRTVDHATLQKSHQVLEKSEAALMGNGVNFSYCTVGTETTSFSEDGDEHDEPFSTGAFRIDDLLNIVDGEDSLSEAAIRTSFIDCDASLEFLAEGLPREIIVLDEGVLEAEGVTDVHQRLRIAETLVMTYKAKMQSTENMADNLHEYLRQAQTYAEDVLADRDELLREIENMHEEEQSRMDQLMFLKVIMASSLCYYICGGSPMILTYSVGLYLVADTLNSIL